MQETNKTQTLLSTWNRLVKIQQLICNTKSIGLNCSGKAKVSITKEGSNVLIFHERGSWSGKQEINFSNVLRWTLDLNAGMISLEHLRYGYPIFLVSLVPFNHHLLISECSHVCGSDIYTGKIHLNHDHIHLNWHIISPKKTEELDSYYSF